MGISNALGSLWSPGLATRGRLCQERLSGSLSLKDEQELGKSWVGGRLFQTKGVPHTRERGEKVTTSTVG